ncbi:unnamed protein product, partial [Staurois parvus]
MASRDTHDRRLADAQQQAAFREVGDLRMLSSRHLPRTKRSAGRTASQGPSNQQTGWLPRAPQRSTDRMASQGPPSDRQIGRLPRAPSDRQTG